MTRVMIDGEIASLAATLREACGSAPHRAFVDRAIDAFSDGATIGDAYVSLLRHVLEPLEIAVIDASHPDVARAVAAVTDALTRAMRVAAAAARRTQEIVDARIQTAGRRHSQVSHWCFSTPMERNAGSDRRGEGDRSTPRHVPVRRRSSFGPSSSERLSRRRRMSPDRASSRTSRRSAPWPTRCRLRRRSSYRGGPRRSWSRGSSGSSTSSG